MFWRRLSHILIVMSKLVSVPIERPLLGLEGSSVESTYSETSIQATSIERLSLI